MEFPVNTPSKVMSPRNWELGQLESLAPNHADAEFKAMSSLPFQVTAPDVLEGILDVLQRDVRIVTQRTVSAVEIDRGNGLSSGIDLDAARCGPGESERGAPAYLVPLFRASTSILLRMKPALKCTKRSGGIHVQIQDQDFAAVLSRAREICRTGRCQGEYRRPPGRTPG